MPQIELLVGSGDERLSVRSFAVREGMSSLFEVSVEAVSPHDDINFEAVVGAEASLRLASGIVHARRDARAWVGVCSHLEQVRAESSGLSTYRLRLVPRLWLLTQRRNYRVFQHLSVPAIVGQLLAEWGIDAEWRVSASEYPKLPVRTQYGESDYAFVARLLEEAGVSFFFEDEGEKASVLILHDRPSVGERRGGEPIRCVSSPNDAAEKEYVTDVLLSQDVRAGQFTYRDFDFRRNPELPLFGVSPRAPAIEGMFEQYHYAPGSFLVEGAKGEGARADGTPVADDKGAARHDDRAGKLLAERSFEASRASRRVVSFRTNVIDLRPGVVFSMDGHARADLAPDRSLLVTEFSVDGSPGGEWTMTGRAVFADGRYRPHRRTPKPHVSSVQSAVVVGPKGEEIHTDEYGRVRVQFHWDRLGRYDEQSSCWMRVSQGWAGSGFGMMAIPRVGQEVLVGFLEGDPDQPVVVGRLYNNTARVPYKLPENKAVSGWRSDSTPGSSGFNELRFDDSRGQELVHVQAERNLTKLVKVEETETTGLDRTIQVGRKLTLTTGEASIILEGPNITIEARGSLRVLSREGEVVLEGGPNVKINPGRGDEQVEADDSDDSRDIDELIHSDEHRVEDKQGAEVGPFAKSDESLGKWGEYYSHGIVLRGSNEFRERTAQVLDDLDETRTGRKILDQLGGTERVVNIAETKSNEALCRASHPRDAHRTPKKAPGLGTDSTILFNPDYRPSGVSQVVVIGRLLIDALHNAAGTGELGKTHGVLNRTLKTIGISPFSAKGLTENALRREVQLPSRTMTSVELLG